MSNKELKRIAHYIVNDKTFQNHLEVVVNRYISGERLERK